MIFWNNKFQLCFQSKDQSANKEQLPAEPRCKHGGHPDSKVRMQCPRELLVKPTRAGREGAFQRNALPGQPFCETGR